MALPTHVEEAITQLEVASWQVAVVRSKQPTVESVHEWPSALTDYVAAVSTVHELDREPIQERLDEIAGRLRLGGSSAKESHPGPPSL
jgi:hypothetical protein